jgi:signal transduction histidine kinase
MRETGRTVSELAFLLKLLPVVQEMETVDKIYRLLVAMVTTARIVGYRRAMLFAVDASKESISGRFGVTRPYGFDAANSGQMSFEDRARKVFEVYEGVESSDLTVQVRSFTVPLAWHRSALVKAARTTYPVLAERETSEYATDPFFDFFGSSCYIAVPMKINDHVAAVLAADGGDVRQRGSVDEISLLYSLAQQASTAAQNLIDFSEMRRRSRIVRKLQSTLSEADTREKLEEGLRLALIMVARAVGGSGCLLKDLTHQKTIHIKTVQEYSPEAGDDDVAISESFDGILDDAAARMKAIAGDREYPYLSPEAAKVIAHFRATPLVAGENVSGALLVYREVAGSLPQKPYSGDDAAFLDLCAGIIAAKLEIAQLEERAARGEEFLQEVGSNLARERERSRLAERSLDFHADMTQRVKDLTAELSSKQPYAKRIERISDIVKDMKRSCRQHVKELYKKDSHYELTDVFDVTRRVVQDHGSILQERGIGLTVRIPSPGPALLVDKSKISVAVENIIRATASCLKKGDKMLVECSNARDRVLLCFADNSAGLPGDAISRLVMPFSEAEPGDERKRALSLAGEIIQKHSGEILIKSSMSWKTILILSLPKSANRDRRHAKRDRRRRSERRAAVSSQP